MSDLPVHWLSLIVGLVIGLALGLWYTWAVSPVELVNTYPALLRSDYRWTWIRLTALSYAADGNLERALARLDGLEHEDVSGAVGALIDEYAAAGRPVDAMRRLTALAATLDVYTPAMAIYLHTPASSPAPTRTPLPTPSLTPTPFSTPAPTIARTPTPKPTRTPRIPSPTPSAPIFQLVQQEQMCQPGQAPRIEVVVQDEDGQGLTGIEIWLMWPGGADRAVTGLKPQGGVGYADFDAEPGVDYMLGTSELGMPLVTGLRIEPCPDRKGKEPLLGSWRIVLQRRSPATPAPESES